MPYNASTVSSAFDLRSGPRWRRSLVAGLSGALLMLGALSVWWPAAAQALTPASFGSPTNFPSGTTPLSVAVGDFNGDSDSDLATANTGSDDVSILLGNGNGGFSPPTNFPTGFQTDPQSIAVGTFNGDPNLDVATANATNSHTESPNDVSVLFGTGSGALTGAFQFEAGTTPSEVAVGDFNNDSKPDLAVADQGATGVSILLGDGFGNFTGPTSFAAFSQQTSVAVGLLNADGTLDLAVTNQIFPTSKVSVLMGNGSGGFSRTGSFDISGNPEAVVIADLNADSKRDLAVATLQDTVFVLLGDGLGNFAAATGFPTGDTPNSLATGDFNGDGSPDLVTGNGGDVSVLLGNGDGTFAAPANFPAGGSPLSVAVGEFNGDSRPDLAVSNFTSHVSILLNTTGDYATPQSARRIDAGLVPVSRQCGTGSNPANGQHSPPLGTPSCLPPQQNTSALAVGPASVASAHLLVRADSSDVDITASASDVRDGSPSGPAHNGNIGAVTRIRFTDHYNCAGTGCSSNFNAAGTGSDTDFGPIPVTCAGGSCAVTTSANAVLPGSVVPGKQAVVQVFRIRINDSYPTGTLFAQQGIYIP
jgi:hypothetical protein